VPKPQISHLDKLGVHFVDNSSLSDIDTIILATGYQVKYPFLTNGGNLPVVPVVGLTQERNATHLSTNLRYIYPLHEHVLSLSSEYPLGSLYFIGLPTYVFNAPDDRTQSLFAAHTIANSSLLYIHHNRSVSPNRARQEFLNNLYRREDLLRSHGINPDLEGHGLRNPEQTASQHQEKLVEWLKERGVGGLPKGAFVEPWRRRVRDNILTLSAAWRRIEALGEKEVKKWVGAATTEEEWVDVLDRLTEWGKKSNLSKTSELPPLPIDLPH
jgi:hypothetical protein